MRLHWLLAAAIVATAVAYLQVEANIHFLYWRFEWFDILMHFLGGLAIATFLIGFFVTKQRALLIALFFAIAIGWEIFEVLVGSPREANYALDTVMDLIMDTIGGALAYIAAKKTIWR